jgi:hypothetical protein
MILIWIELMANSMTFFRIVAITSAQILAIKFKFSV